MVAVEEVEVFPGKKEESLFNKLPKTDSRVAEGLFVSVMVPLTGYGPWSRGGGRGGPSLTLSSTSDCTKGPVSISDSSALENEPDMRLLLLGKNLRNRGLGLVAAVSG